MISLRNPLRKCVVGSFFFFFPFIVYDRRIRFVAQIKPLTKEEKEQKLAELKARMAEKRTKKAVEEAKEAKANEQIRRKSGKVGSRSLASLANALIGFPKDIGKLREELKAQESIKEMEKKKRGKYPQTTPESADPEAGLEKADEAKARAIVKAQIEADKKERAEKAAREKALREGVALPQEPATTSVAAPPKPTVAGKDFPETRLQIRMESGGQPYVTTLSSDASEYTQN